MKQLTIVNHSREIVLCRISRSDAKGNADNDSSRKELNVILPSVAMTLEVKNFAVPLTLTPQTVTEKSTSIDEKWSIAPNGFSIRMPMAMGAFWKVISRKHHRLLILPRREMNSFLEDIPDSVPLSCLMLPGTHDTMAFYGWPISQCQSLATPLAVQLASGIRMLDIRLAVKDDRLIAYHGLYPQRAPFQEILGTIHDFLTAPESCKETLVMSIKQEDFATVRGEIFSKLVREEIFKGPGGRDMWFLDNRIPLLGQVRGKVVMFSRFGGEGDGWEGGLEGIGIHPTAWPDSRKEGFSWDCKNTLVQHSLFSLHSGENRTLNRCAPTT
ncbi:hypothetical protein NM688_g5503 [Phlebia brevispora]|uniref:Uncharacterized protein n=1 Tax=Phlebia brevispora TaxID=194682 RepID=A0ACC1SUK2_9APHY|nr:hypothetical protein NM688_g5503 [Phlebia brevispora]